MALHFLHTCLQPYEGKVQNVLDSFFYLNLILLTAVVLYFNSTALDDFVDVEYISVVYAVNTPAVLMFLLIVILHINIQFTVFRSTANKIYQKLRRRKKKQECDNLDLVDVKRNDSVTFTELRESLLDDRDFE